jgi:hypothetical protein
MYLSDKASHSGSIDMQTIAHQRDQSLIQITYSQCNADGWHDAENACLQMRFCFNWEA